MLQICQRNELAYKEHKPEHQVHREVQNKSEEARQESQSIEEKRDKHHTKYPIVRVFSEERADEVGQVQVMQLDPLVVQVLPWDLGKDYGFQEIKREIVQEVGIPTFWLDQVPG